MAKDTMIIGIAGASASGKTLLANTIVEELGSDQVVIISEDSYYKDHKGLSMEKLTKINYDHPDAFEHDLLCKHLRELIENNSVNIPLYDYTTHSRKKDTRHIGPHTIIVLEGILLFVIPELRKLMDIMVYMGTPLDICLLRRFQRDIIERERSFDSVLEQYQTTVRPMYFQFIEPSKRHADIIVPRGGANRIAIDIIKAKMRELLQ